MVAVTYDGSRVAEPAAAETKTGEKGKGFFARLFVAITDAQMKRAERELALHRHLLPFDFKLDRTYWTREDNLPFGGW